MSSINVWSTSNENENSNLKNIVKFIITISCLLVIFVPLKFGPGEKIVSLPWTIYITHVSEMSIVLRPRTCKNVTLGMTTIHLQGNP